MKKRFYSGKAYKFLSTETLKTIIQNESLRFTRGDSFNDPFEANPFLVPVGWESIAKEDKSNVDMIKYLASEAFTRLFSKTYVTCLSSSYLNKSSQLMWSHYGNSHRGVCFEIDFPETTQENYEEGDMVPLMVTYCENLCEERSKWKTDDDELPLYLATHKSDVWKYESEIRLVFHTDSFDKEKYNAVNDGKNADVVINIESITKVIFGVKSNADEIIEIVKLFADKGHLPVFFRLDLSPITLELIEYELPFKKDILEYNKNNA